MKKSIISLIAVASLFLAVSCDNGNVPKSADPSTPPSSGGSVSITFKSNEHGTGEDVTRTLAMTDSLPSAEDLGFTADEGYLFVGWGLTASTGSENIIGSDYPAQCYSTGTTSAILYAVWSDGSEFASDTTKQYKIGSIVLADGTILEYKSEEYSEFINSETTTDTTNPAVGVIAFGKHSDSVDKWDHFTEGHYDYFYAASLSEVYMLSIYCTNLYDNRPFAKTGAVGATQAVAQSTPNPGTSSEQLKRTSVTSFTGETDGNAIAQKIEALGDFGTVGNYPSFEVAKIYGTDSYWSSASNSKNRTAIPESSKYASGWYVPSITEICAIFANDGSGGHNEEFSPIVGTLAEIQKLRKVTLSDGTTTTLTCTGATKTTDTNTRSYGTCFSNMLSSSDADDTSRWYINGSQTNSNDDLIKSVDKTEGTTPAFLWFVRSVE